MQKHQVLTWPCMAEINIAKMDFTHWLSTNWIKKEIGRKLRDSITNYIIWIVSSPWNYWEALVHHSMERIQQVRLAKPTQHQISTYFWQILLKHRGQVPKLECHIRIKYRETARKAYNQVEVINSFRLQLKEYKIYKKIQSITSENAKYRKKLKA